MASKDPKTEYAQLNAWRISKLARQDQWGAILFPGSLLIFTGSMTLAGEKLGILILGWLGSALLLFLWRWNDHAIDRVIRRYAYPRLVELEEVLEFESVRFWLKQAWWTRTVSHAGWLPTRADVEARNGEIDSLTLLQRLRALRLERPLFGWDGLAFILCTVELAIVAAVIAAKIQGWTWAKYFL